MAVETETVVHIVEITHVKQNSGDRCACPAFARVTMDNDDMILVL
jgi:hypothetical protein